MDPPERNVPTHFIEFWDADTRPRRPPVMPALESAVVCFEKIPRSGWLDNVTAARAERRLRNIARQAGLPYRHPKGLTYSADSDTIRDPSLAKYINKLRADLRRLRRANRHPREVNYGIPEDPFDEDMLLEAADPEGGQLAARQPRSQQPTVVLRTTDRLKLEALLLDCKPLMDEGIKNARNNHRLSEHAIESDEVDGLPGIRLMPHQRDAVGRWEYLMEKHRAAFLADDMGLGKTLTIVAVVLRALAKAKGESRKVRFLIVVPSSLILTWLEALRNKAQGITVLLYSSKKAKELGTKGIEAYDVVLCPMGALQAMFGRLVTTRLHKQAVREGFDDEVIRLLTQIKQKSQARIHRKSIRPQTVSLSLERHDEPLLPITWDQIIVDEQHNIKNPDINCAIAVRELKSRGRGGISGTPVQNGYHDFGSLLQFLDIPPFNDPALFNALFVHKKRRGKRISNQAAINAKLNDAILSSIRSAVMIRHLKNQVFEGVPILGIEKYEMTLYDVELSSGAQDYQDSIKQHWDMSYRQQWEEMRAERRAGGLAAAQETNTLLAILRARLHVLHPAALDAKYGELGLEDFQQVRECDLAAFGVMRRDLEALPEEAPLEGQGDVDPTGQARQTLIQRYARELRPEQRALCETRRAEFLQKIRSEPGSWKSDKLHATVGLIERLMQQRRDEAAAFTTVYDRRKHLAKSKIIVFAEFLSVLDILEVGIHETLGFHALRFDGMRSLEERASDRRLFEEVGKDFRHNEPHSVPVMLLTSKAGAEGIELIHASDVIILTPAWNPYVEKQSIDSANRHGREGFVMVHRMFCNDSIERRILDIQSVKTTQAARVIDDAFLLKHARPMSQWEDHEFIDHIGYKRAVSAAQRGAITWL